MTKIDPIAFLVLGVESLKIANAAEAMSAAIDTLEKEYGHDYYYKRVYDNKGGSSEVGIYTFKYKLDTLKMFNKMLAQQLSLETLYNIEDNKKNHKDNLEGISENYQSVKEAVEEYDQIKPIPNKVKGKKNITEFKKNLNGLIERTKLFLSDLEILIPNVNRTT